MMSFCRKTRDLVSKGERQEFTVGTDGILFYRNRLVVPDATIRERLLREAHESAYAMHPGSNKMYHDVRGNYWWPVMKKEISEFTTRCLTCQQVKAEH